MFKQNLINPNMMVYISDLVFNLENIMGKIIASPQVETHPDYSHFSVPKTISEREIILEWRIRQYNV